MRSECGERREGTVRLVLGLSLHRQTETNTERQSGGKGEREMLRERFVKFYCRVSKQDM